MVAQANEHAHTLGEGAAMAVGKTAPPVAVSALTLYGVQLSQWVLMATLLYTVLMIIHVALEIYAQLKGDKCE